MSPEILPACITFITYITYITFHIRLQSAGSAKHYSFPRRSFSAHFMPYSLQETPEAVILSPRAEVNAAVVWLHGLGADGHDFVPIADELRLPSSLAVRFVFPHARPRAVTINNGFVMRAWYDITGFGPERSEDEQGIRESEDV